MIPTDEEIQRVANRLVADFRPHKVILFGSRATGSAGAHSDVDLLIVLPFSGSPVAMMSAMLAHAYRAMPRPFAIDVHPRRPMVDGQEPDAVMRDAIKTGVVLYEAAA